MFNALLFKILCMVLIISKRSLELTTEKIIDWLYYYGCDFVRLNGDDFLEDDNLHLNPLTSIESIECNGIKVKIEAISCIFFRRWSDRDYLKEYYESDHKTSPPFLWIENFNNDMVSLRNYMLNCLADKQFIPSPKAALGTNKLINLMIAKKVGFDVPKTIVTRKKKDVEQLMHSIGPIITKDLEKGTFSKVGDKWYLNYTSVVDDERIGALPESFAPSLFQEQVDKLFEIRLFYFFRHIYAMAIFSQNDEKTNVDFRNYNYQKPNRCVPYNLPSQIASMIREFMNEAKLNTGSIDLLHSKSGKFFFLEVNPVGQIGMVSQPCNYNLEKIIAEKLATYDREYTN